MTATGYEHPPPPPHTHTHNHLGGQVDQTVEFSFTNELDPAIFVSAPGLARQTALKKTKVNYIFQLIPICY